MGHSDYYTYVSCKIMRNYLPTRAYIYFWHWSYFCDYFKYFLSFEATISEALMGDAFTWHNN